MLSYIAAVSENGVIGRNNSLIWSLPEDLNRFKEITSSKSKTMIMGRKTYESLPKVLPGRKHIIITRNMSYKNDNENVQLIHDINKLQKYIDAEEEYFVIGGGQIYSILKPYAEKMYLTIIHEKFEGDAFFPEVNMNEWKTVDSAEGIINENNKYRRTYLTLIRK